MTTQLDAMVSRALDAHFPDGRRLWSAFCTDASDNISEVLRIAFKAALSDAAPQVGGEAVAWPGISEPVWFGPDDAGGFYIKVSDPLVGDRFYYARPQKMATPQEFATPATSGGEAKTCRECGASAVGEGSTHCPDGHEYPSRFDAELAAIVKEAREIHVADWEWLTAWAARIDKVRRELNTPAAPVTDGGEYRRGYSDGANDVLCRYRTDADTVPALTPAPVDAVRVTEEMVERGAEAFWNIVPRGGTWSEAEGCHAEWRHVARTVLTGALAALPVVRDEGRACKGCGLALSDLCIAAGSCGRCNAEVDDAAPPVAQERGQAVDVAKLREVAADIDLMIEKGCNVIRSHLPGWRDELRRLAAASEGQA